MIQAAVTQNAREASLQRRKAMSSKGKAAIAANTAVQSGQAMNLSAPNTGATTVPGVSARKASLARREAMSKSGKAGVTSKDRTRVSDSNASASSLSNSSRVDTNVQQQKSCGCGCNGTKTSCDTGSYAGGNEQLTTASNLPVRNVMNKNIERSSSRAASLARRQAMSSRGKAGINSASSSAQTSRAANPDISSRELAKALREEKSRKGKQGDKKSQPCGRSRPNSKKESGAVDASWKVGASETAQGQTMTGTMVGRSRNVTGDEPSTCREITGTDYFGADMFREFCKKDPSVSPRKVKVTSTSSGNPVSGSKVGRSLRVTGDEPGTCKRVTGNEYVDAKDTETFCNTKAEPGPNKVTGADTRKGKKLTGNNVGRSEKVTGDESGADRELSGSQYMQPGKGGAPAKVGQSATLRGSSISGTVVGRSQRVTGDEPGSCKFVTGDDYLGQEQYKSFCNQTPAPQDRKVGVSNTFSKNTVTGTLTERTGKVTGNEPGTCKVLTGTPYAGAAQMAEYCTPEETNIAVARTRKPFGRPGAVMTGQQPGVAGKMTGASKGVCEDISGTPYIGADQFTEACPATAADTASPDFPQTMGSTPWGQFSVTQPSGGAQKKDHFSSVTGSRYEQGQITGPFGMATGKVTGTEEARFGGDVPVQTQPLLPATAEMIEGRVKSRITGEGMDAGPRITGDDWDRGDNVTGTEGPSAIKRNTTMRTSTGIPAAVMKAAKRNEQMPEPVSKVTGGSGNTEKGSLITYSGGARG